MKLVIISGRSGSGKSTVLNILEDNGYFCIDNLPAGLLPSLIDKSRQDTGEHARLAICIDARNQTHDIKTLPSVLKDLPDNVDRQLIYLDANSPILIKRFSETRRKHPLSNAETSLREAINKEKLILEPISAIADLQINTNDMSPNALKELIKRRLCHETENDSNMSILFSSFGFKNGVPIDADVIYDVRCLPNPYWEPKLRAYTGKDQQVIDFLSNEADVQEMISDIRKYLEKWLPKFEQNNRSYVTIAIGCTGGQHRSVFISENLNKHFSTLYKNVQIFHRDLGQGH